MLKLKCVYSAIIQTPIPEDHQHHRKYKNAPHPYIIIPPLTRRQYFRPDDSIFFDFVLIGKANEYLPYFIYTFTEMGRIGIGKARGKFDVSSVDALGLDGTRREIFSGIDKCLKPSKNRIDYTYFINERFKDNEVTISFETPVRIKKNESLVPHIPFKLFINRLSERAFLLAHFHCNAELGDYEGFAKGSENVETILNNLRWVDWERYSTRQKTRMKFGGWVGNVIYKGYFQKYWPLLRLGEHIHVGKAATFGLGKYRIM